MVDKKIPKGTHIWRGKKSKIEKKKIKKEKIKEKEGLKKNGHKKILLIGQQKIPISGHLKDPTYEARCCLLVIIM